MISRYMKLDSPLYCTGSLGGFAVNCNRKYYRGILVRVESPDAGEISEDHIPARMNLSTIFDPAAGHALGRSTITSYSLCNYIFLMESQIATPCMVSR